MWIKFATVIVLFIIVGSLFSALYYLFKEKGSSDKTVKALTVRIGLSIILFASLIVAANFGYIGHSL
jgi:hypothetical protein